MPTKTAPKPPATAKLRYHRAIVDLLDPQAGHPARALVTITNRAIAIHYLAPRGTDIRVKILPATAGRPYHAIFANPVATAEPNALFAVAALSPTDPNSSDLYLYQLIATPAGVVQQIPNTTTPLPFPRHTIVTGAIDESGQLHLALTGHPTDPGWTPTPSGLFELSPYSWSQLVRLNNADDTTNIELAIRHYIDTVAHPRHITGVALPHGPQPSDLPTLVTIQDDRSGHAILKTAADTTIIDQKSRPFAPRYSADNSRVHYIDLATADLVTLNIPTRQQTRAPLASHDTIAAFQIIDSNSALLATVAGATAAPPDSQPVAYCDTISLISLDDPSTTQPLLDLPPTSRLQSAGIVTLPIDSNSQTDFSTITGLTPSP